MSFGGGSGSQTDQQSRSFVDPRQQPFLQSLRSRGQRLQESQQAGLNQFASEGLGGLFQQGQQLNQGLGAISGQLGGVFDAAGQFSNREALQGQIGNLGENLGQFFNEQLLPGIDRTTQLAGQGIGSGRNAVARGQARRDTLNAFSRGTADLNAQFGQQQLGALGLQGQLSGQQAAVGQQQLGNLPGLANLGLSQFTAPFAGLQQQQGLVGGPTILDEGTNRVRSTSIQGPGIPI